MQDNIFLGGEDHRVRVSCVRLYDDRSVVSEAGQDSHPRYCSGT
jgi:hypothetical protein